MRWASIKGYDGRYEVSESGAVRSVGTRISPRVLKLQTRKRDGYVVVGLHIDKRTITCKVHRLVAAAFIPNTASLPHVDHINGVRGDNRAKNLRWASASLNGLNRLAGHGETGMVGAYRSASLSNPYRAAIRVNGVKKHLGVFKTAEEAAAARAAYFKRSSCV